MSESVYIYCADVYCESCGSAIRAKLTAEGKAPADPADEHSYDSDDFPKGPFSDGGGESDSPQHCSDCKVYLFAPLTAEGQRYTAEALWEYVTTGGKRGTRAVLDQWAEDLGDYSLEDADVVKLEAYRLFREHQHAAAR